jgi:hypothetical protein
MIEEVRQILNKFDQETVEFLELNKREIFKSIATNQGIPEEIGNTLRDIFAKREIIVESISRLEQMQIK